MKIETVISAKALWFVDLRYLSPRGRDVLKLITPRLQHWYGFATPKDFDQIKGVRFEAGEFSPSERADDMTGVSLTVYHNGLVAECSTSTDDSDAFLERAFFRLAEERSISYDPGMIRKRNYASEVIARSDRDLDLGRLAPVYTALSQMIYPSGERGLSWSAISLDIDQLAPERQVPFRFERRAGVSFREGLYYSHGPISTANHQMVLDILEECFSERATQANRSGGHYDNSEDVRPTGEAVDAE